MVRLALTGMVSVRDGGSTMLHGRYSFSGGGLKSIPEGRLPEGTLPIEQTENASLTLRVYDLEDLTDINEDDKSILDLLYKCDDWEGRLAKSKHERQEILDSLCSNGLVQKEENQYTLSVSAKDKVIDLLKEAGFYDSYRVSTALPTEKDRIKASWKHSTQKP